MVHNRGSSKAMPVLPQEVEFYAQDEMVRIVPSFSLQDYSADSTLHCIRRTYGPFRANFPTEVPIWAALILYKRKKCRILPPDWMNVERLRILLNEEKEQSNSFQPIPFYYIEVANLLLSHAVDAFGEDIYQVRDYIATLKATRFHKLESGLKQVTGAVTVKINNLAAGEINLVRSFFGWTLDQFYKLGQANTSLDESQQTAGTFTM